MQSEPCARINVCMYIRREPGLIRAEKEFRRSKIKSPHGFLSVCGWDDFLFLYITYRNTSHSVILYCVDTKHEELCAN